MSEWSVFPHPTQPLYGSAEIHQVHIGWGGTLVSSLHADGLRRSTSQDREIVILTGTGEDGKRTHYLIWALRGDWRMSPEWAETVGSFIHDGWKDRLLLTVTDDEIAALDVTQVDATWTPIR